MTVRSVTLLLAIACPTVCSGVIAQPSQQLQSLPSRSDRSNRPSRPGPPNGSGNQNGGNRPSRPGSGGPQVQPPRPAPGLTPGPGTPGPGNNGRPPIQPPRPGPGGTPGGNRPGPGFRPNPGRPDRPPQWGRPPQNRPSYQFRSRDRDWLRRFYFSSLRAINLSRRPVFVAGNYFPVADIGYLTPVPPHVYSYLPPPPPGYDMGYFDGYVVVYDPVTYFIANVIDLVH